MIIETPPTPEALQEQFHIPRTYLKHMAAWLSMSESMLFQIVRQGRKPAKPTIAKLQKEPGIPEHLWDFPVDIVAKKLYTLWYEQLTPYQANPHEVEDLF